jgi:hypothetical protein
LYMLSNKMKEDLTEKIKSFTNNNNLPINKARNTDAETDAETDTDTDTETDTETDKDTDTDTDTETETETKKPNSSYTHYVDTLNKAIPNKKYKDIRVCLYKIITDEMYPFIMFLLYKYENNILNFIKIDHDDTNHQDIITHILSKFKDIFSELPDVSLEYKGFIESNKNEDYEDLVVILKYNTSSVKRQIQQVTYDSKWWWLLSSEIINYKKVLNFDISSFSTKFLLENNKLMFLYDDEGNIYETPDVGYYGNHYKKIASVASLGLSRQGIYSSFGPYYYFSTYTHAMRNAIWNPSYKPMKVLDEYITVDERGRYTKGGIVRFALFSGRTKVLMGRSFDKPDASHISIELALKNEFVAAMIKLRDSDGRWTEEYNSIRIGSHTIKLKDKPIIYTDPLIALKEYEQHVTLEYYYVDTAQDISEEYIDKANIL